VKTVDVKLFVEGGGESNSLRTECRAAFSSFLEKAGLAGYMPRIVASGSRTAAFEDYCIAISTGEEAILLVDSETEVLIPKDDPSYDASNPKTWKPWHHLKNRKGSDGTFADNLNKPLGTSDEDCHLMVESMETWFLADVVALKKYYGKDFNENKLPKGVDIEKIKKDSVIESLENATHETTKKRYSKGSHSFGILSMIDPNNVMGRSIWAKRFIDLLFEKMKTLRDAPARQTKR
jgi:hypothetical protein